MTFKNIFKFHYKYNILTKKINIIPDSKLKYLTVFNGWNIEI